MQKFTCRAFLALVLAAVLIVPAGTALRGRKQTAAYYENRRLASFPPLTRETALDGSFGAGFESWFSDHVPGRTAILKADTAAQLRLGRPVVNDVAWKGDVLLPFQDFGGQDRAYYQETAALLAERFGNLKDHVEALHGAFVYAGLPEQRVYFQDRYPAELDSHAAEYALADGIFTDALTAKGVTFLDLGALFDAQGHPDAYYSALDHHYSGYGAYAAYRGILEYLNDQEGFGLPVLSEVDLEFRELPNPFIGTRNRKLYNLWPNHERAVICVQRDPVPFDRTDNGQLSEKPLFVYREDPTMPTTYDLYMGGDFGETVLETHRPDLPDIVIFGDSFTNALETLLYASFDTTRILDLRYYKEGSLKDYLTEHRPDVVLCVMNDLFYYQTGGNGTVWED